MAWTELIGCESQPSSHSMEVLYDQTSHEMLHNLPTLKLGIKAVSCQCLVKGDKSSI